MSVVKIFTFLGLAPRLNFKDLTGQAKLNIFQRSLSVLSGAAALYKIVKQFYLRT